MSACVVTLSLGCSRVISGRYFNKCEHWQVNRHLHLYAPITDTSCLTFHSYSQNPVWILRPSLILLEVRPSSPLLLSTALETPSPHVSPAFDSLCSKRGSIHRACLPPGDRWSSWCGGYLSTSGNIILPHLLFHPRYSLKACWESPGLKNPLMYFPRMHHSSCQ